MDIVERLRFLASGQDDLHSVEIAAAADEIERLRWALDFIIRVDRLNDAKVAARAALGEKE